MGKKEKLLQGRQMAWIIYQHYKTSEQDGAILEITDLLGIQHNYKNLKGFMSAWESTLEGMKEQPSDDMLETLLLAQLEKDTEISSLIALYKQDIN